MEKLGLIFPIFFLIFAIAESNEPFPGTTIKEIKFGGGVAGATSYHNAAWSPEIAFKEQQPVNKGWHVGPEKAPAHNPPVLIWYDFKRQVKPAEVSLQPAQEGGATQGAPSSFQFVGSNDGTCNDEAHWTVLCEDLSDRAWRNYWEVRYCRAKPEIREAFRCLGIRVLANRRSDGWTSIRNIRMWEK